MSSESDQLTVDYEEVQAALELYPRINIIQVEGEPPDSYEIEYLVTGYVRSSDGSIETEQHHRVRINLPFGYPHFPPSVKPLTPIFHPDMDPDAVRITAFWQQNPSLSELIVEVGEMICGNSYNLAEPFNQEAADWYARHLDDLPLDSLQVADIEFADDSAAEDDFLLGGVLELEEDSLLDGLVLEEDAEEEVPFGLAGEAEETVIEEPLSVEQAVESEESSDEVMEEEPESYDVTAQLDLIGFRIGKKEIVKAERLLEEIPESAYTTEVEDTSQVIRSALEEAEQLLAEARGFEDDFKFDEALECVDRVSGIVADYVGMSDIHSQLQQSRMMADSFSDGSNNDGSKKEEEVTPPPLKEEEPVSEPGVRKKVKRTASAELDDSYGGFNLPLKPIVAGVVLLLIAGTGWMVYSRDAGLVKNASASWQQVQNLTTRMQFFDAETKARTTLEELDKILVLRSEKNRLKGEISSLINDTDFQQGIAGKVKYKGEYLLLGDVAQFKELESLTTKADEVLKAGKVRLAIAAYDTARVFAEKNELHEQAKSLSKTADNLRIDESLTSAGRAEKAHEWENAAETYQNALALAEKLADSEEAGEIRQKMASATFKHQFDQSKKSFTDAQWGQTIAMLDQAKKMLVEHPETGSTLEREEIDRLLANANLYQLLALARQSYEAGDVEGAIGGYEKTLVRLKQDQAIHGDSYQGIADKIAKIIFKIRVAREYSAAQGAENSKDLAGALARYRAIEKMISGSVFKKDNSLRPIEKKSRAKIRTLSSRVTMNRRTAWLKNNFEKIFKQAYPSAVSSQLSHPRVTYIKTEGKRQVFNITCSEKSQGSTFRLDLNYQYDLSTGKWSIYSGQL